MQQIIMKQIIVNSSVESTSDGQKPTASVQQRACGGCGAKSEAERGIMCLNCTHKFETLG
jgi:hypothetical protein